MRTARSPAMTARPTRSATARTAASSTPLDEGGSTKFTFTKIWLDGNNAPGLRPTGTDYTKYVTGLPHDG